MAVSRVDVWKNFQAEGAPVRSPEVEHKERVEEQQGGGMWQGES